VPALQAANDDVIEGEAHTVEINVAELKALIAAAEAAEAAAATGSQAATPASGTEAAVRDIRIRRVADDPAHAPR
jgi:hypothetical protein